MTRLSQDEREAILEQAIREHEAKGYYVKTQTATDAKLIPKHRKAGLALDGVLTLATFGAWALPAAAGAAVNRAVKLHVDTRGGVTANGKPYDITL